MTRNLPNKERKTGFKPATLNLERLMLYPTELLPRRVSAIIQSRAWAVMDSNHRRLTPSELQSDPFDHSGNYPAL